MKEDDSHLEQSLKDLLALGSLNESPHPDAFMLADFKENLLSEDEADDVRLHLAACSACCEKLAKIAAVLSESTAEDLISSNVHKLPQPKSRAEKTSDGAWWRYGLVAAAAFVAALLIPRQPPAPPLPTTHESVGPRSALALFPMETSHLRSDEDTLWANAARFDGDGPLMLSVNLSQEVGAAGQINLVLERRDNRQVVLVEEAEMHMVPGTLTLVWPLQSLQAGSYRLALLTKDKSKTLSTYLFHFEAQASPR